MRIYFVFFLLYVFAASCSHENSYYQVDKIKTYHIDGNLDTLQGNWINYDSLNDVRGLECVDSFVVILRDGRAGVLYSIMDAWNDSVVSQLGALGHANNELLSSVEICQFTKNDEGDILMFVQDYEKHAVARFNLSQAIKKGHLDSYDRISYKLDESSVFTYHCFALEGDGYLLHQSVSSEGDARDPYCVPPLMHICRGKENKILSFYPSIVSANSQFLPRAYTLMPRLNPNMTKFVEVHGLLDLFTIVDLQTEKTLGIVGKNAYGFDYVHALGEKSDDREIYSNLKICNVFCNVSKDYIFVCQDGNTPMSQYEDIVNYKPRVCIFDWEGELIYSFTVREPLMRIAYNEKTCHLYGFDSTFNLYKYDLTSILGDKRK